MDEYGRRLRTTIFCLPHHEHGAFGREDPVDVVAQAVAGGGRAVTSSAPTLTRPHMLATLDRLSGSVKGNRVRVAVKCARKGGG